MPVRRDRDDVIAAELERVADALRADEAAVYVYDVEREPTTSESGGIAYPGGWFEFRFERRQADDTFDRPGPQE